MYKLYLCIIYNIFSIVWHILPFWTVNCTCDGDFNMETFFGVSTTSKRIWPVPDLAACSMTCKNLEVLWKPLFHHFGHVTILYIALLWFSVSNKHNSIHLRSHCQTLFFHIFILFHITKSVLSIKWF